MDAITNSHYRVVTARRAGTIHKAYFKTYESALKYFKAVTYRGQSLNYIELQERDGDTFLTIDEGGI